MVKTITFDRGKEFSGYLKIEEKLELVQSRLNNRPRKCINFKTPNKELFGNLY